MIEVVSLAGVTVAIVIAYTSIKYGMKQSAKIKMSEKMISSQIDKGRHLKSVVAKRDAQIQRMIERIQELENRENE